MREEKKAQRREIREYNEQMRKKSEEIKRKRYNRNILRKRMSPKEKWK